MSRLALLTTLLALGCATGQSNLPSGSTRTHTTIDAGKSTYDIVQETTPDILTRTVSASLDRAWAALPAAYGDLRVPLNAVDATSHMIGSGVITAHRQFAGMRLSKMIDCGTSGIGEPRADGYTVHLNVRTQLSAAAGGGTVVRTLIEAAARDAATSDPPVRCATTGALERRIADALGKEIK